MVLRVVEKLANFALAQLLGTLAKNKKKSINHIGLATPIRSNNGSKALQMKIRFRISLDL